LDFSARFLVVGVPFVVGVSFAAVAFLGVVLEETRFRFFPVDASLDSSSNASLSYCLVIPPSCSPPVLSDSVLSPPSAAFARVFNFWAGIVAALARFEVGLNLAFKVDVERVAEAIKAKIAEFRAKLKYILNSGLHFSYDILEFPGDVLPCFYG
jgi:hypothetical protein